MLQRTASSRIALCFLALGLATACGGESGDDASGDDASGGAGGDSSAGTGGDASGTGGGDGETFTGSFTIDGDSFDCEVSTQVFAATDEFSVLCQKDGEGLVQITFKDEASARTAGSFTPTERSFSSHPDATTVDVSYQTFGEGLELVTEDGSTGTVVVTATGGHSTVTLTDVSLVTATDETTGTVSATIEF